METTRTFLGNLLVATDGSANSTAAIEWLADVAAGVHAERINVVHVWALDQIEASPQEADDEAAVERGRLAAMAGTIADLGIPFDVRALDGGRKAALTEEVERVAPDLVAVGQGHHRFGSGVVRHLAHAVGVPLAVIPTGTKSVGTGDVVVGVDGSPANMAALRWATRFAVRLGRGLRCVYAPGALAFNITHTASNFAFPHEGRCRREVEDVTTGELRVTFQVVYDDPVTALESVADEVDAPAIIVGTRGRGGLDGVIVGSVPMHLLQHATHPVVLVRHG